MLCLFPLATLLTTDLQMPTLLGMRTCSTAEQRKEGMQ